MRIAYADTSCFVAIALGEDSSGQVSAQLARCDLVVSSNLLEAELRSALLREGVRRDPRTFLRRVTWVHPQRALTPELTEVLSAGYLKGADVWHLGCALYLRSSLPEIAFLSLDHRQRAVAATLGLGD